MCKCNDCNSDSNLLVVRGSSDLAGGVYYVGPGICEECCDKRKETAIAIQTQAQTWRSWSNEEI